MLYVRFSVDSLHRDLTWLKQATIESTAHKGHLPSANLRKGGKTLSVLVYSLLLSHGANLGFTLSITLLRYVLSYPHVKLKISELEPSALFLQGQLNPNKNCKKIYIY